MVSAGEVVGGKYRVDRVIGAGGMGIVVEATHLELRQPVALKLLRRELSQNPTILDRFMREARTVAALRTEHVCRVVDVVRDGDVPFIVMELLRGADLASTVARQPLPVALATDYLLQACVALAEAHALDIVHRDLKPANLFVTRHGDGRSLIKVLDFGIAKAADELRLTHSTSLIGSPGYMSPEQLVSPRDVDKRTDIWSLGVTLYQLVSARLPFPATQLAEYTIAATTSEPAPLAVDPQLRSIIWRCLAKDPAARYPDIAAFVAALAPFAGSMGSRHATHATQLGSAPTNPLTPASQTVQTMATQAPAPVPATPPRKRRWLFGAIAAALVVGGIVTAAALGGDDAPVSTVAAPASPDAAVPGIDAAVIAIVVDAARDAVGDAVDTTLVAAIPDAALATSRRPRRVQSTTVDREPADPIVSSRGTPTHLSDPAIVADYEAALARLENQIAASEDPRTLQILYKSVAQTSCFLHKREKVKLYMARLTDDKAKTEVRSTCRAYGLAM